MTEEILSKYGGSSLTNAEAVEHLRKITEDDPRRNYIVVSAPGDAEKRNKVTNRLIHLATLRGQETAARDDIEFIVGKFETIYPGTGEFVGDELQKAYRNDSLEQPWYAASLRALGEELQGKLLARELGYTFVPHHNFMVLSEDADGAKVLPETYNKISQLTRKEGQKLVFPGYGGVTKSGKIATLSRDGTNVSASVIAAARKVHLYENFSDSPVLAANPRIVPHAAIIPEMTYKEMRDLSYSGFTIFHKEAILPLIGTGIPIHLRSIHSYPQDGTRVVEDRVSDLNQPVVGIAYKAGFASFNIERDGLNDEEGVLYALLQVFHAHNIPPEFIPTGIDDISIIFEQDKIRHKINELKNELYTAVGSDGTKIEFTDNLGCIAVAGKGLVRDQHISAKIERILADNDISVIADSKGVLRRCFIYAVDMQQGHKAVNVLYDQFFR